MSHNASPQLPEIVLFEPEIPPNTGNIIRLAANTGFRLSLIEPLGFQLSDKALRRAGLDYSEYASLNVYPSWSDYLAQRPAEAAIFCCTTKSTTPHTAPQYQSNASLVFGPESRGLPQNIRESVPVQNRLRIPMQSNSRSINLSNAVSIFVYEAWRQLDFIGSE